MDFHLNYIIFLLLYTGIADTKQSNKKILFYIHKVMDFCVILQNLGKIPGWIVRYLLTDVEVIPERSIVIEGRPSV